MTCDPLALAQGYIKRIKQIQTEAERMYAQIPGTLEDLTRCLVFGTAERAGGIIDPVARHHGVALESKDLATAVGRFVPGEFASRIVVRFFPGERGYAWWFPRADHASLGVEMAGEHFNRELAWKLLTRFAAT